MEKLEITTGLRNHFTAFAQDVNIKLLNRGMKHVVLEFIKTDSGRDELYLSNFLSNVQLLYRLLDAIEDECQKQNLFSNYRSPRFGSGASWSHVITGRPRKSVVKKNGKIKKGAK